MGNFHWVDPPHKYGEEHERWEGRPVIVCDYDGCDWVGTSYASQYAIHELRHHDGEEE